MIDHFMGRPNPSWKRLQVFLVVFFWIWRILYGNPGGPRILWLRRANRLLRQFTPWQLIVSTLTGVYAVRNIDKILGLGSPEPLANLYSPNYYRATWISTGLDAGFATAMSIRPKWLKDLCSVLFSVYYIVYAQEADEKLRRFRAVPTVEFLRTTWEKTANPYLRLITSLPRISIRRKVILPRPSRSAYQRQITAWLFFAPPEHQLSRATELILDFPGGGFISMAPEHHEDRLRMWAVRTGKPVLSIEYGKAPEYPYPYAIDECFDAYCVLGESCGRLVGMAGTTLDMILTGDSAGAHVAVAVMIKILETQLAVPHPLALQLNYAALDFNFTSWMAPQNLRVLQSEQSSGSLPGLIEQKDHFKHVSPLSMVGDRRPLRRQRSWRDAIRTLTSPKSERAPPLHARASAPSRRVTKTPSPKLTGRSEEGATDPADEAGSLADEEDGADLSILPDEDKPIQARVRFHPVVNSLEHERPPADAPSLSGSHEGPGEDEQAPLGTRLTMTSRTGYFQDRIIAPSMMRAMAILFIGPHRNPDFASDYHLSPVLAPDHLLAQFPLLIMSCGEKDPFVDDTIIFAGRVRQAKRARRRELEQALVGKGAKYGEHLRMSVHDAGRDEASVRAMKRELSDLKAQTEEDWVQLHIFSDWSHGYMQMAQLMQEARTVINDLADRMDDAFAAKRTTRRGRDAVVAGPAARKDSRPPGLANGGSFLSTPLTSETEAETDDALTFSPKRRSPPLAFSTVTKDRIVGRMRSRSRTPQQTGAPDRRAAAAADEDYFRADDGPRSLPPANGSAHHAASMPLDASQGTPTVAAPLLAAANGLGGGGGDRGQTNAVPATLLVPSTPTSGSKAPAKAGQTITESELMRRRRLLDSHLITSANESPRADTP
ncbi:uncharacterized protein PHACADRAFT_123634 [Phanerochaete carnosa HHB-10118-sp]|uniref:Alpha/beta hydrolase fold-3 domain-containing protein n=1 Tax=Phanerochaete carnosa (strain HHB-10118-sp) TaxID=650164 RepID=K5WVM6_PHACS|nr:uncharacterized protein PHACADRAFT_123634 [Phanerochaete carnosa HHB-10118-sp]EKM54507.1 hypothetical protein PHACADRAFT_123634 [Phanerochaete carnosa HHB-10118-sp]